MGDREQFDYMNCESEDEEMCEEEEKNCDEDEAAEYRRWVR